MGGTVDSGRFGEWYACQHARLVAALTLLAGDLEVARDVAGEAFSRALERWDRVADMENPSAWTYTLALNILRRRRWRHLLEARKLRKLSP